MPNKFASEQNATQKTRQVIRSCLKKGDTCLKFIRYEQKYQIIYKLNKGRNVETNKLVINQGILQYLGSTCKNENRIQQIFFDLCQIKDQGFIAFLSGNWNHLVTLDLSHNQLTVKSIKAMNQKGKFQSLKHLILSGNQLQHISCMMLVNIKFFYLEELNLNFNQIGNAGIKCLSTHPWSKLREFHLRNNNIGNKGIIGLSNMNIPLLQRLVLGDNKITNDGCKFLSRGLWRQLKCLQVDGNFIQDDGLHKLTKLGAYNLQILSIFASRTDVINVQSQKPGIPTMAGLIWLIKGCWSRLKVEMSVGICGPTSKDNLLMDIDVRQMMQLGNVEIMLNRK